MQGPHIFPRRTVFSSSRDPADLHGTLGGNLLPKRPAAAKADPGQPNKSPASLGSLLEHGSVRARKSSESVEILRPRLVPYNYF